MTIGSFVVGFINIFEPNEVLSLTLATIEGETEEVISIINFFFCHI